MIQEFYLIVILFEKDLNNKENSLYHRINTLDKIENDLLVCINDLLEYVSENRILDETYKLNFNQKLNKLKKKINLLKSNGE